MDSGFDLADRTGQGNGWQPRLAAWRPGIAAAPGRPPRWMRALLAERGSLTARLERLGPVRVDVLRQGRQRPTLDEAVALGLPLGRHAWLREVVLACEGNARVYARSLAPHRLPGPGQQLSRLGERPLGRLLFSAPDVERGPVAVARLRGHEPLARWLCGYGLTPVRDAWARRSTLSARGRSILITEVFFPWSTVREEDAIR